MITNKRKKHLFLSDNSLFHAVFSCTEHVYCENNLILFLQMIQKEKNFFLKMFIVTDLVSLNNLLSAPGTKIHQFCKF